METIKSVGSRGRLSCPYELGALQTTKYILGVVKTNLFLKGSLQLGQEDQCPIPETALLVVPVVVSEHKANIPGIQDLGAGVVREAVRGGHCPVAGHLRCDGQTSAGHVPPLRYQPDLTCTGTAGGRCLPPVPVAESSTDHVATSNTITLF